MRLEVVTLNSLMAVRVPPIVVVKASWLILSLVPGQQHSSLVRGLSSAAQPNSSDHRPIVSYTGLLHQSSRLLWERNA